MLRDVLDLFERVLRAPITSVICFALALVINGFFQTFDLYILSAPAVALLTLVAAVCLAMNYYRMKNWLRIISVAACVLLVIMFGADMICITVQDHPVHSGAYDGYRGYGYDDYDDYGGYDSGDDTCYFCDGTRRCHTCSGQGGFRCDSCHASGRCDHCNGSGTSRGYGTTGRCGACRGSGDCSICDGTGTRDCNVCYGSGACRHCY